MLKKFGLRLTILMLVTGCDWHQISNAEQAVRVTLKHPDLAKFYFVRVGDSSDRAGYPSEVVCGLVDTGQQKNNIAREYLLFMVDRLRGVQFYSKPVAADINNQKPSRWAIEDHLSSFRGQRVGGEEQLARLTQERRDLADFLQKCGVPHAPAE
jgi:hypothetical protein